MKKGDIAKDIAEIKMSISGRRGKKLYQKMKTEIKFLCKHNFLKFTEETENQGSPTVT